MLTRLLSFVAVLVLACASTAAHATARAPERVSAPLSEQVQEWKTAHRGSEQVPATASKETPALGDCHVGENWHPPLKVTSDPCLYAYANPTVWVDRNGQTAELAAINLMLSVERQDSLDAFTAAKREARARAWYDLPGKALSGAEMVLHGGSVVALAAGEGVFGGANLMANTVIAGADKLGASEYVPGLADAASQSNGELNEMFEEVFPAALAAQENTGEALLKAGDAAYDGTIGVAERAIAKDDSQAQIDLAQMANPMKLAKRVMNAAGGRKRIVLPALGVVAESGSGGVALKPAASTYQGGPHSMTSKPTNDGLDSHHMPAKQVSGLGIESGPAIKMDPTDHDWTSSNGKRAGSRAYREKLKQMIDAGRMRDAMATEVRDVRKASKKVSNDMKKYNEAMQQMLEYAKKQGWLNKVPKS